MTSMRIIRPDTAFSNDRRTGKKQRQRDRSHLAWVGTLPSLITGSYAHVEVAHVRYADPAYGKPETGMGKKPDDKWVVPLSADLHRDQHSKNERDWWETKGIDPLRVALELWIASGDTDQGIKIIERANQERRHD